jgi:hypothetical protein
MVRAESAAIPYAPDADINFLYEEAPEIEKGEVVELISHRSFSREDYWPTQDSMGGLAAHQGKGKVRFVLTTLLGCALAALILCAMGLAMICAFILSFYDRALQRIVRYHHRDEVPIGEALPRR